MTKGKRKLRREEVKIITAEISNREKLKLRERWRSPTGAFGALPLTYMSHLRRFGGWAAVVHQAVSLGWYRAAPLGLHVGCG